MKEAVATSKLKELVEISKKIDDEEFQERKGQSHLVKKRENYTSLRICQRQIGVKVVPQQEAEKTTLKYLRRSMKHHW